MLIALRFVEEFNKAFNCGLFGFYHELLTQCNSIKIKGFICNFYLKLNNSPHVIIIAHSLVSVIFTLKHILPYYAI